MKLYFGPNYRYFFDDGHGNYKYRAPPHFLDLFRTVRMRSIAHVAFGTGDSFFLSYVRASDNRHMYHFQHDDHYPALKSWLFDEGLDHGDTAYVSLGENDAFFAASKQGHRWRNIPEDACDFYQKYTRPDLFARSRVNTIDLGHNDTFLGITIDNTWFWDLKSDYPTFEKLGIAANIVNANWVMISPYAADQHFVVFNDGTVHYALPQEWAGDVANLMQLYVQQQQRNRPGVSTAHAAQGGGRYGDPRIDAVMQQYGYASPPSYIQQPARPQYQQPQPQQQDGGGSHFDVNEGMQLANNVFDAYNNLTNAGSSSNSSGSSSSSSSTDVNQALSLAQTSVDTINNLSGYGSQGLDMANTVTNTGLMIGQLGGQLVGAAAGCVVM